MKTNQPAAAFWTNNSSLIPLAALFGIPGAGLVALLCSIQIPRLIYGRPNPLMAAAELGSLGVVVALVLLLRAALKLPSAPTGFYRDVLDFLAMSRWHPAMIVALAGILILPPAWYIHGEWWFVQTMWHLGHNALKSGDVQDHLDGIMVTWQLALTGGVPLLFALHMLSRWQPKRRWLPWLLVPALFVGVAIGVVLLVVIAH